MSSLTFGVPPNRNPPHLTRSGSASSTTSSPYNVEQDNSDCDDVESHSSFGAGATSGKAVDGASDVASLRESFSSGSSEDEIHFLQEAEWELERKRTPIFRLPAELIQAILGRFDKNRDILACMLTCRRWSRHAAELIWYRPSFVSWAKHALITHVLRNPESTFPYASFIRRLNLTQVAVPSYSSSSSSSSSSPSVLRDEHLQDLLCVTRVERLTLTGCRELTDKYLAPMIAQNPLLLAIDFSEMNLLSDKTISAVAENCPRIQGLNLAGLTNISTQALRQITQKCRFLKRIKLNNCVQVDDETVLSFVDNCPYLLEVDLQMCDKVTDESVRALMERSSQLRELRLPGVESLTNKAFLSLPPDLMLDQLRILDLTSCDQLTDEAVDKIVYMAPRLRNLVLSKCRLLTDASMQSIARLGRNLHFLHMGSCVHLTDEGVRTLTENCTRIRYIDLGCCINITDVAVKRLAALTKLKRIGLVKCSNITNESLRALAKPRYRNATPHGAPTELPVHPCLERVHLSYCTNLTEEGVRRLLAGCVRLTHLSLTGIPAFFHEQYQQYSRPPPLGFNEAQRSVFCVYSGIGIEQARQHFNGTNVRLIDRQLLETRWVAHLAASQGLHGGDDHVAGFPEDDDLAMGMPDEIPDPHPPAAFPHAPPPHADLAAIPLPTFPPPQMDGAANPGDFDVDHQALPAPAPAPTPTLAQLPILTPVQHQHHQHQQHQQHHHQQHLQPHPHHQHQAQQPPTQTATISQNANAPPAAPVQQGIPYHLYQLHLLIQQHVQARGGQMTEYDIVQDVLNNDHLQEALFQATTTTHTEHPAIQPTPGMVPGLARTVSVVLQASEMFQAQFAASSTDNASSNNDVDTSNPVD